MGGFYGFAVYPAIFTLYFLAAIKQLTPLLTGFYLFQLAFDCARYDQTSIAPYLNQKDASTYDGSHSGLRFDQPLDD